MLFLAIIGVVIFLLAIFSVMSAHQNGGGWKFLAFIAVLSGLVTIYAVVKLPYWPYNQTATATAKKNAAATSSADAKKASSAKLSSSSAIFNEDSQKRAAATTKLKEENILKQLQTNYKEIGTVAFDKPSKTFTITPTGKNYVKSLKIIKAHPTENQKAITTITSNFTSLSKSLKKNLAAGYTIRLLEPGKTDTTLISLKDGQVVTNNLK